MRRGFLQVRLLMLLLAANGSDNYFKFVYGFIVVGKKESCGYKQKVQSRGYPHHGGWKIGKDEGRCIDGGEDERKTRMWWKMYHKLKSKLLKRVVVLKYMFLKMRATEYMLITQTDSSRFYRSHFKACDFKKLGFAIQVLAMSCFHVRIKQKSQENVKTGQARTRGTEEHTKSQKEVIKVKP
ncbi:hypothetical protein Tco_0708334 [Tanacetum coccineum]